MSRGLGVSSKLYMSAPNNHETQVLDLDAYILLGSDFQLHGRAVLHFEVLMLL